MRRDAFSDCHPAVNFFFFGAVIVFSVTIQHPAYLLAGFLGAASYLLALKGRRAWRLILGIAPIALLLTAVNPLFNRQGSHVLFWAFGGPYTLEALVYGAAVSAVLVIMLLWFGCYNAVVTGDKFTALFGSLIPALSLVFVMILRLVPGLLRKAGQISGALSSIGRGTEGGTGKERLRGGMTVLWALTAWAMEGSVVTADSMRSRGYGTGKCTSFQRYRMDLRDWLLLCLMLGLTAALVVCLVQGSASAAFTPDFALAPLRGRNLCCLVIYCVFLLIPTFLHIKEDLTWYILRSGI